MQCGVIDSPPYVLLVEACVTHLKEAGLGRHRHDEERHSQVEEGGAVGLALHTALHQLVELQAHQARDRCRRRGDGWDDAPSYELALEKGRTNSNSLYSTFRNTGPLTHAIPSVKRCNNRHHNNFTASTTPL